MVVLFEGILDFKRRIIENIIIKAGIIRVSDKNKSTKKTDENKKILK